MQLVMLVNENDFRCVEQNIFEQLVRDLESLETDGLTHGNIRFSVVLSAICGDNLGSHCIGGFVQNFSTCEHFCVLTKTEFDNGCLSAHDEQIRTPQSYHNAVATLHSSNCNHVEGVKYQSIFNRLKSYHICQPGLPPCVAHDLFEGVVAFDIPLFLRHFVKQKYFAIDSVNKRLECLQMSSSDSKTRPPSLSKSLERLTGTASQNWCLLRLIPVLMSDDVYQTLLLLREAVELIMAPAICTGQVAYMKVVIEDYLQRRRKLFPEVRLRPKHHYLTHYASLTLKFGPLIRLWTLRFEIKHQFFKRCIRNSRNFVDVTGMLANRHQLLQAYLSAAPRSPACTISTENVMSVDIQVLSSSLRQCLSSSDLSDTHICTEVTVRGTTYAKNKVLPLRTEHSQKIIMFGQIQLLLTSSCVRVIVLVRYGNFDFDMGCYVLADGIDIQCVNLACVADFYPLDVYKVHGKSVVILKHQILDIE